jgi:hypothetical protein
MEERAESPPLADQEAKRPIRSEGKGPEAARSQGPAPSSSQSLKQEQEAQGESTLDLPNFDQLERWQFYVPKRMVFVEDQGPILTKAQEAGQVINWVGALRDSLTRQDQERRDIEELFGCLSTQLWSTALKLKKKKDEKVIQMVAKTFHHEICSHLGVGENQKEFITLTFECI